MGIFKFIMTCETNPLKLAYNYVDDIHKMMSLSFGPNGGLIIIQEPGMLFVTGNGTKILESCGSEQPISKIILKSATLLKKREGDGTKRFIFILRSLLKSLDFLFVNNSATHARRITFILFLDYFENIILEKLQKHLHESFTPFRFYALNDEFIQFLRRIIGTCLKGKFPQSTCDTLSTLLEEYFQGCCVDFNTLDLFLEESIRVLQSRSIHVPNSVFGDSHILEGLIIRRDFAVECDSKDLKGFHFVALELQDKREEWDHLETTCKESLSDALWWKMKLWKQYVVTLKQFSVNIILSSGGLEEFAVRFCKNEGISVVHYIDQNELERVIRCSGVTVCFGVTDEVCSDNIGRINSIKKVVFDSNINLLLSIQTVKGFCNKEFIFCGPTLAMTKQYSEAVCDVMKVLKSSIHIPSDKDSGVCFFYVPAQGYIELVLNHYLRRYKDSEMSAHAEDFRKYTDLFSDALLSIPRTLIQNGGGRKRVVEIQHAVATSIKCGCSPRLSNSRTLEPLFLSVNVLRHVTAALRRLARIECVVPVKKLLPGRNFVGERCDSPD